MNRSSTPMSVAEILAALVGISSVSHEPNGPVIDFVRSRLEPLGWTPVLLPYHDPAGVEKFNALFLSHIPRKDLQSAPYEAELVILSHTDTVPFAPAWPEGGQLADEGERLVGRGACDVKGFLAAAVFALEKLGDPSRYQQPLALVLTADEEVGCIGAKRLAESGVLRARRVIVGEPTSLRPVRAGKGYGLAEVVVRGQEAHSAFPAVGVSAIFGAARLLANVEKIAARLERADRASGAGSAFDPPFTTLNVGVINGGSAKNIVPGECRFLVEWRPIPGADPQRALRWLEAAVVRLSRADANFRAEVHSLRLDPGFETPADSPWVRQWEAWSGASAGTVSFGTEAPHAARFGSAETVVLGPGDMLHAHRPGESVPRRELELCAERLHAAALAVCKAQDCKATEPVRACSSWREQPSSSHSRTAEDHR